MVNRGVVYRNDGHSLVTFNHSWPVVYLEEDGSRYWGMLRQALIPHHHAACLRAWALRDQMSVKYTPAMVAMVQPDTGYILFQNSHSISSIGEAAPSAHP